MLHLSIISSFLLLSDTQLHALHNLFITPLVNGHLGCFQVLAIMPQAVTEHLWTSLYRCRLLSFLG